MFYYQFPDCFNCLLLYIRQICVDFFKHCQAEMDTALKLTRLCCCGPPEDTILSIKSVVGPSVRQQDRELKKRVRK